MRLIFDSEDAMRCKSFDKKQRSSWLFQTVYTHGTLLISAHKDSITFKRRKRNEFFSSLPYFFVLRRVQHILAGFILIDHARIGASSFWGRPKINPDLFTMSPKRSTRARMFSSFASMKLYNTSDLIHGSFLGGLLRRGHISRDVRSRLHPNPNLAFLTEAIRRRYFVATGYRCRSLLEVYLWGSV